MRLDSHQHFWKYNPAHQVWMTGAMDVLRRDYLPGEVKPLLRAIEFDGSIAVQARQMVEETEWLLQLSDTHDIIKGVVGWVDLRSPPLSGATGEVLKASETGWRPARGPRRVRRQLHAAAGVSPRHRTLHEFGLTYDLLLFPKHVPAAVKLAAEFPDQPFVLDHIAKPSIRTNQISPWAEDLKRLAEFSNVFCKLSGLVTEAAWKHWRPEDFHRYLDIVIEAFGAERVMIGSDWPVCTLSGDYESTMRIVIDYARQFPAEIREAILGGNCARFYGLDSTTAKHKPKS